MDSAVRNPSLKQPLLFLAASLPADRVGCLCALHAREGIELGLFGGRIGHGPAPLRASPHQLPFPVHRLSPQKAFALARRGPYRALILAVAGRLPLAASWLGARLAKRPVLLWSALWAHPLTPFHLLSYLPLRHLYRSADVVLTYGPHVSRYVLDRGALRAEEAPQAVDNDFWRAPPTGPPAAPGWLEGSFRVLYAGRFAREKGLAVLLDAWPTVRQEHPGSTLALVGDGPYLPRGLGQAEGVYRFPAADPPELRNFYGASDVLVVPSIRTWRFCEPWGLVVNEALNQGVAVVASSAVGAAAGGLLANGRTGLVVEPGQAQQLAAALLTLAREPALRKRLGEAGKLAVGRYTFDGWAEAFSRALAPLGLSRRLVRAG